MKQKTAVTLMAGGGGKAIGAVAAGYDLVGAVEYDPAIAEVYAQNVSKHVHVGKVEERDPRPFVGIDALLASPACTRMSVANANCGETDVDRVAAEGVCRWLRVCRPHLFVMENVTQYLPSDSCQGILACLREMGYQYDVQTVNAADFGVPQTRRRLIVRAVLGGPVPPLVPTHVSPDALLKRHGTASLFDAPLLLWVGWYAAIEDIIDTLPPSQFAPWQLARLKEAGLHETLLVEGDAAGDRPPTCRTSAESAFTLKTASGGRVHRAFLCGVQGEGRGLARAGVPPAPTITTAHDAAKHRAFLADGQQTCPDHNGGRTLTVPHSQEPALTIAAAQHKSLHRAWLEQGRVVKMTNRALARFQSFPDWYILPPSNKLASTIIGNAVPCLLAEAIMRSFD